MGSCVSKDPADVREKTALTGLHGRPKIQLHNVLEKPATGLLRSGAGKQSPGRVLGGAESEREARAALARAAEERFVKQQRKLSEGNDKLRKLAHVSRSEKGL